MGRKPTAFSCSLSGGRLPCEQVCYAERTHEVVKTHVPVADITGPLCMKSRSYLFSAQSGSSGHSNVTQMYREGDCYVAEMLAHCAEQVASHGADFNDPNFGFYVTIFLNAPFASCEPKILIALCRKIRYSRLSRVLPEE